MNELTDQPEDQVVEVARRVSERDKKAPNISVEMADGIAHLSIGKNSDPDERLRLMAAMGTYDLDFLSPLLSQIGNSVAVKGEFTAIRNFVYQEHRT